MKYSIVMPVYKRLDVINLSIKSVLKQSLKPSQLIFVDNNTCSFEINSLKNYINSLREITDLSISYIKSPKNSGALARNIGTKFVTSELVAFLDSDVVLDRDYYEKLISYFEKDNELIAIQGIDRSLLDKKNYKYNEKIFRKLIYFFEQFFETSLLFNKKQSYVSPSLAVAHPNFKSDFEINSEWISTCAGIFKRSLFKKYSFPKQFVTYSNNEYLMFSYRLFINSEGKMIYTSKAKYRDIQTNQGRINKIQLMYQIETYDLYIFMNLFDKNIKSLFIYIKSRIGHLFYNLLRLLFKKNLSIKLYLHSIFSIFYPLWHICEIKKGDLSFYENDFPIE